MPDLFWVVNVRDIFHPLTGIQSLMFSPDVYSYKKEYSDDGALKDLLMVTQGAQA